jgi:hypothetical protein
MQRIDRPSPPCLESPGVVVVYHDPTSDIEEAMDGVGGAIVPQPVVMDGDG